MLFITRRSDIFSFTVQNVNIFSEIRDDIN